MPTLPNWAPGWLLARNTADAGVILATFTHASFETIYLVRDAAPVTSRGIVFAASFFEINLVNDDGKPPRCQMKFPNVLPEIGRRLARVVDPVEVAIEAISLAHPDEPVMRAARLQLRNVMIQPDFITGDLMGRDYSNEPLGTKTVVPARFPAMFRRRG